MWVTVQVPGNSKQEDDDVLCSDDGTVDKNKRLKILDVDEGTGARYFNITLVQRMI